MTLMRKIMLILWGKDAAQVEIDRLNKLCTKQKNTIEFLSTQMAKMQKEVWLLRGADMESFGESDGSDIARVSECNLTLHAGPDIGNTHSTDSPGGRVYRSNSGE